MADRDSQAASTKANIRCSICLINLPISGCQCAHLFDSASIGAKQLQSAIKSGLVSPQYTQNSSMNGIAQCPTCHIAFFAPDIICLSPPIPVLKFLLKYLKETPSETRKPLYQVLEMLRNAAVNGSAVDLPDYVAILPYVGLFSIVLLNEARDYELPTLYLPYLSILINNQFTPAPRNESPRSPRAARIFDSIALGDMPPPVNLGTIPLSYEGLASQRRYWRLPADTGAVLFMLMDRTMRVEEMPNFEEINLAQDIRGLLIQETLRARRSGGAGLSGDDAGPSGGRQQDGTVGRSKRKASGRDETASASKKGRRDTAGEMDDFKSEDEDKCDDRPQNVDLGDWEVASSFSPIDDATIQSASSPVTGEGEAEFNDDDFEGSDRSANSATGTDPKDWQFDPSFSTNRNAFTVTAMVLI